jgi:hypothetical protein
MECVDWYICGSVNINCLCKLCVSVCEEGNIICLQMRGRGRAEHRRSYYIFMLLNIHVYVNVEKFESYIRKIL